MPSYSHKIFSEKFSLFWPTHTESQQKKFTIITASDSSHYKSLCQLLSSIFRHEPNTQTVVFDLGLSTEEQKQITTTYSGIEMRTFNYSRYPDYFDVKKNAGEYAWKPVIIHEMLEEKKGTVCWMDAGNIITGPLKKIRKITYKLGMYSPHSSGIVSDWTHPSTLKELKTSQSTLTKHNLNGACISLYHTNETARHIAAKWKECALKKEIIAPSGSNRQNHRQDQAVLSVLAHESGITKKMPTKCIGFKTHQDID